jgi:hypothetical protein
VDHELEEECAYKRPFAVVMATKGGSAAKTFLVGSNTIYAVRNLPYPVLVVPQHVLFKPITKITLASDLKEFAGVKVIKCLREWLHEFKSSLDIINVVDDSQLEADALPESISLQNLLGDFRPRFHFLEATGLEEGIYRFIEENRSDLLVVIPRRHGLFEILLHKSASKPFILHPHIPVLAIAE